MSNFIKIQTLKTSIFLFLLGLTFGLNAQISVTFETNAPSCHDYTNGSATATATGGTAPYSYNWSNGQNGATNSGLSGSSYTVNVSDASGLSTSASVTISTPEALIASIAFDGDACGSGAGSLAGNATGGTAPYSYAWSNGASGQTISGLAQGNYYLTATDANGCGAVAYYQITASLAVNVSTIDVICNDFCDASAEAIVTGGTAPYSYAWNTGMTGSVAFPLPAGQYCVTVTDGNGCVATNCGTVAEPTAIETTITLNGDCDGAADISATVAVTGGVPEYSINWSNGSTGTTITGLAPNTTYSVTVSDANGCNDVESFTSPSTPSGLTITSSSQNEVCAGDNNGTASVVASGGVASYNIMWSTGSSSETISGLAPGDYGVTVSDANGCTGTQIVTIAAGATVNVSTETTASACGDSGTGSLTITPTGGMAPYFFIYENGIGNPNSGQVSGLSTGTYNVTVGDAQGCTTVTTINVPEIPEFTIAASVSPENCAGAADGTATVTTNGAINPTYLWDNASTDASTSGLSAGPHSVTVTDANGCIVVTQVNVAPGISIDLSSSATPSNCGGASGSISIVPSGGANYSFTYENGIGDSNSGVVSNLAAGDYNVTVTDTNSGCSNTTTVNVPEVAEFTTSVSATAESCAGAADGTATVVANGAIDPTYLWDNDATGASTSGLSAGPHSVTVTDANGCTVVSQVDVAPGVNIELISLSTPSACGDVGTGSISIIPTGGTDYSFAYENGIGAPDSGQVNDLLAGDYNVTVTDNNSGCSNTIMVTVGQEVEFTLSSSSANASCNDTADGLATVIVGTEVVNPTYIWDNGSEEDNTGDVAAGDYTVTVTDTNGCAITETVTVEADDEISAEVVLTPGDCTGDMISVTVSANSTSDITEYLYTTSNGDTFTTADFILDIPAGETVTVTLVAENAAGCAGENESTFTAEPFEPMVPEAVQGCLGEELTASANSSTGDTYTWSSVDDIFIGATDIPNPEINTSVAGEFPVEVTITNAQGCSLTEEVMITVTDSEIMPDPNLVSSTQNCDGTSLDFTNTNDSADSYEWIFDYPTGETVPGGGAGSYEYPEAGIYEVALIPTVGCADTVIVIVEVTEPQVAEFVFETNCENGFTVVFTDMSSNPADITGWNWVIDGEVYDQQNPSVEFENAGTVDAILTVSYGDDCVLETMQPIDVAPFTPTTPMSEMVDCDGGTAMELFPNANTTYDYEWSPAGGLSNPNTSNPTATVTETTTYMLTIIDPATGCTELSEVTITVPDALAGPTLDDISTCQVENEMADATVTGGVNYIWSDDENFDNVLSEEAIYGFTVSEVETTYYILVEDEFGCTTTESFTAGAYPIVFDFGSTKFICEGDATLYDLPDGLTVDWGGDDPADTPIFEEDFFVGTVTNEANCSLQDTLFAEAVIVTEGLEIDATPDTILLGDVSELFVTPDVRFTYEWDNGETLNDADIHNPTAKPEETTIYTVTVRDGDGCEGELDVQVVVENNCEPFLFFPNAFTPDDDGLNDVLFVEGLSLDEVFFAIYNRWGEKVYESNDITEGWDGTFKGEVVCPDVYGYYLRVRCTDGNEIFRKGNVSVLR